MDNEADFLIYSWYEPYTDLWHWRFDFSNGQQVEHLITAESLTTFGENELFVHIAAAVNSWIGGDSVLLERLFNALKLHNNSVQANPGHYSHYHLADSEGEALDPHAIYKPHDTNGSVVRRSILEAFPGIKGFRIKCPAADCQNTYYNGNTRNHNGEINLPMLVDEIIHLNDVHRWTREEIADWLDTVSVNDTLHKPETPVQP